MHTRNAGELAALYPRWHDFRRVRASLDPQGMFLNGYLRELFDADTPVIPGVTNISAAGKDGQELDLG